MRRLAPLLLLVACSPLPAGPYESLLPAGFPEPFDGPAWVVFEDKPVIAGPLGAAELLTSAAELRRLREHPDRPAVRPADQPVSAAYLGELSALGLELRHVSSRLNAVSVESLDGGWDDVVALPFVRSVRPLARRVAPRSAARPAGLSGASGPRGDPAPSLFDYGPAALQAQLIEADLLHRAGWTGEGVLVAVTDTGFVLEHEALQPLEERVVAAWDFLDGDSDVAADPSDDDAAQQNFHGSAVLSVLAGSRDGVFVGIAPDVSLLLARTESITVEETFEEDAWVAAAEWAEAQGAEILSSSLGWRDWYLPADLDGATAVSTVFAEDLAVSTGLFIVTAMGNAGPEPSSLFAPADAPSVLAVGAVDGTATVADFSGRGPSADGRIKPDVAALGQDAAVVPWDQASGATTSSGTSFAAPALGGLAALLRQANPSWTRVELFDALRASGSQAEAPDNDLGWGVPSGWDACGLACSCVDADADGFYAVSCGGRDCDDSSADVSPEGLEIPYDGIDQDCDGADLVDQDGDGFAGGPSGPDCGDLDPSTFPDPAPSEGGVPASVEGGHELCSDGRDNDCDGLPDQADPDCPAAESESASGGVIVGSSGCVTVQPGGGDRRPKPVPLLVAALGGGLCRRRRARRAAGPGPEASSAGAPRVRRLLISA